MSPIDQCATVFGAKMQSKFKRNKKLSKWPVEDVLLSIIGSFRQTWKLKPQFSRELVNL